MKNVTITEISGRGDVNFDQAIDTDTVIASGGGIAVNGNVDRSAFNTGLNTGILAGDDVNLDDSIVGDGNTQINDSTVGAFAARGNATNVAGENVNMGSGDLLAVDAQGDAQVVNGHGNRLTGDIDVDVDRADGPMNFAFGDGNRQNALEDNSVHYEDSFNTDNSIEDSFNTSYRDSFNTFTQDNDTYETSVRDSFNTHVEDNDDYAYDWKSSYTDNSTYDAHSSWTSEWTKQVADVDIWGDRNAVDLDLD
jgi:hypothetical protein